MSVTSTTASLLEAALDYARRGWPVFPCNHANKKPLLARDRDGDGNPIPNSGGVTKASTDEALIRSWWTKWPRAMIGVAVGRAGMLVVDFDPRREEVVDESTGEVMIVEWTLEQLKADVEEQMGCALPASLSVRTPSGGVHVYFQMPDGAPIGNKGSLPRHVDVRGLGGYTIVPPSVCVGDGKNAAGDYHWLRGDAGTAIEAMPEQLVEILRKPPARTARPPAESRERLAANDTFHPDLDEAHRRYALRALDDELLELERTPIGGGRYNGRNAGIYHAALKLGGFVLAGALRESVVRAGLEAVVRGMPNNDDLAGALKAIDNGFANAQPRDLSAVGARTTRGRGSGRSSSSSLASDDRPLPPADDDRDGDPPDRAPARAAPPPSAAKPGRDEPSHTGRIDHVSVLTEGERARVVAASAVWLARRLEKVERAKDPMLRLAFSAGRRVAAGLHDVNVVRQAMWDVYDGVADLQHADVDKALADGEARAFDLAPLMLTMKCAGYPLTDFGIAERFRDRFGADYRFTTGKGWLGWDTRRWKVLDQDEKTPPAEVIAAVFDTVRMIQDEASFIADTGVRWELVKEGKEQRLDLEDNGNPHGLDKWIAKGKAFVLFSDMVRAFGRTSETTGKPASVATLARRWLTVPIEQFDLDPLAIGVLNGTLRFAKQLVDGKRTASVELCPHRREDYNTKLAPIEYDPAATSPLYDDMLAWAQPDAVMRRYLHQVGGYCSTGLTGEHKLWYWYGRGRNGKSTTIDAWCHVLGDYSGTTLIETFLDQGIKKRGDQASPDIARLGGVRLLRSSEPERGAKLNAALIKFVTGGEPVPTRALHRGFFDLLPQFKPIISGNSKPDIPDTDDGIWSRLKLVSWLKNIDLEFNPDGTPKKDPELLNKIKAREAPGVFNRLVEGLLDYLAAGLIEPAAVTADTQAYRDASDPLARFLRDCVVADEHGTVQSSVLHGVFVAWCKAAGEREWTNKGFSNAMLEKGYRKGKSNNIHWEGIRLVRVASDFVDEHGNVRELDDLPAIAGQPPPRSARPPDDDDDMPL